MNYKLSPSDLTFLYDGCKRCFVLKVKHGIRQPSIPIPGVFTSISNLQKDYYSDRRLEEISLGLPPGVIRYGEKWVRSRPIELPGRTSTCYINGRFDIVAALDDGSYAVIDFKTGHPSEEKAQFYGRQLHAYAYALEHPAEDQLHLAPVSLLGLLYFTPDRCQQTGPERQLVEGSIQWIPVPRNDEAFLLFLSQVIDLLDGPLPAPDLENCEWCQYLALRSPLLGDRTVSSGMEGVGSGGSSAAEGGSITDPGSGAAAGGEAGAEPTVIEPPTCPRCGGPMALRDGKYGKFWSCLRYPECKGTRNVS
jgi:hypothetical protein